MRAFVLTPNQFTVAESLNNVLPAAITPSTASMAAHAATTVATVVALAPAAAAAAAATPRSPHPLLHINKMIAGQVQGANLQKFSATESRGRQMLKLMLPFGAVWLIDPTIVVDGCDTSFTELQTLVYTTMEQRKWLGSWIHGTDCRAAILKCLPEVSESHITTGKGFEFQEGGSRHGETHYSGSCTMTIQWKSTELPIEIEVEARYAKFMWDPIHCK